MTPRKSPPKFTVEARVVVITSQTISADSFEDALAKAQAMKVEDFVEVIGEHHDSSIRISSVGADGMWRTDNY